MSRDQAGNDAFLKPAHGFGRDTANAPATLPHQLKAGIEHLAGLPMDDVKVHYNSAAPGRLRAHAYALGTDIHIATGRERDLPHEAWHVAQQKQGRVGPADAQVAGASINDDPVLESEADRMGAAALQADAQADSRPHHATVSPAVQRQVVQRQRVPTDYGEFKTTRFQEDDTGVDIILTFTPDKAKVDAKKIALVQSVKVTNEAGTAFAANPSMANRIVKTGGAAGYTIDASGDTNNPLYFDTKNLAANRDLKDTPSSANTPANFPVNTQYEFGYCYKARATDAAKIDHPASLHDHPEGMKKKGAGMVFETTALAIEGADKDKYYGSVKWGYTIGRTTTPMAVGADITEASKGTPTENFAAPAKLWNAATTRGTLIVNPTSPQNTSDAYVENVSGATTPKRLAKGTKLKQLAVIKGSTEGMIRAEVLDASGMTTGRVVNIFVVDVLDLGDGSANKKLPEPPTSSIQTAD